MGTGLIRRTVCPSCGAENIPGADSCESCLTDLSALDIPGTLRVASESDLTRPISEARLSRPRSIAPSASVGEAIRLLKEDPGGAVVVVEAGAVVGIFTERDVLKSVAGNPGALERPVSGVMTHDPVVVRDDDSMAVVLNKMGDGGFRHIPLVRDGELVALVTASDVASWLLGRFFDPANG